MALSDRFVNRNYLTPGMEQLVRLDLKVPGVSPGMFSTICLKNIDGRKIKTVERKSVV